MNHGKKFRKISEMVGTQTVHHCVDFFYRWKRTTRSEKIRYWDTSEADEHHVSGELLNESVAGELSNESESGSVFHSDSASIAENDESDDERSEVR